MEKREISLFCYAAVFVCCFMMMMVGGTAAGSAEDLFLVVPSGRSTSSKRSSLDSFAILSKERINLLGGDKVHAHVHYEETTNKTGWALLSLTTNPDESDADQAFAAGFVEGYVTANLMETYWPGFNNASYTPSLDTQLNQFLDDNLRFMRRKIAESKNTDEEQYWTHVGLVLDQVEGLYAGYLKKMAEQFKTPTLTLLEMLKFQVAADADDLYSKWQPTSFDNMTKEEIETYTLLHTRCTAFIKYSEDRKNIFLTHATWAPYNYMLRIYKHYRINFKNVPAKLVSFSSSPGWLASGDDFYMTSAGLIITETTNSIYNQTLYNYVTSETVLYWMRNIVANRLAKSAKDWTEIFAKYNSGTYNNQWMIIDTNKFVPGAVKSDPELFYILEQIPGDCMSASMSHILDQRYWPSFNLPYFSYIYNVSGYPEKLKKYGNFFSYDKCPRAKIFQRDAPSVNSVDAVKKLIRYNDYQHDPLSLGDACHQIASRCDLNPGGSAFGAIDAKVTDIAMARRNIAFAQCGPTHDQEPVFKWNESNGPANPHPGQPVEFNFDWVYMAPIY